MHACMHAWHARGSWTLCTVLSSRRYTGRQSMTLEALAELIRALRLYIRQLGTVSESPEEKHKANCVRNSQALPPSLAVCLCISRDISKFHQGNNTYVRPAHWRNPFRKQTECKLCTGVEPRQAMSNANCSFPVLLPFSRRLQLLTCAHTHTPE